ncbi:Urb2/Npa2 family-domain-containing protein [Microdochium trichocladiopsis]|uniref:Urb2/Npa2 family-domain-containing protein n=1 Tax=Microdochium trichocladiopsis TaxID=1682393 RepID=A0A9P8YJT6_9PEZI|nr:Urb2/Npa2 family-domain-containing protein [Microdochium trichocladiopsis]KAH7041272.1 Urb2/Npa2 family-domain-containing protein [Microdochium trichocladiopsis]
MAVPMDVDEDFSSHRVNLIRAVRTIDEDASTTLPAKIHRLWLLLSASRSSRLHGVEETILRWLCKHMAGTTEDAELARRYPLSWEVLAHAFQKIPPQALGKSLADRKFVTILRKTLDEVSKPTDDDGTNNTEEGTNKRKRASAMPDNLVQLRSRQGCIRSSASIFAALSTLLGHGSQTDGLTSPQDRVGVEHIKSLFSSSSEETRGITSRLLQCCYHAVQESDGSLSKAQEAWVEISTALWDLRLHSKEDTFEFARHLYPPVCSILGILRGRVSPSNVELRWTRQLEQLLGTSFIRPARQIYAQDGGLQNLESALELTGSDPLTSSQVLWHSASRTPRDQKNPLSKSEHASWAKAVFSVVLKALEPVPRNAQNKVLAKLLAIAIETRSIPDTEFLRTLTLKNALQTGYADWELLGQIIGCDPDVFLMDQDARDMLFALATSDGSQGQAQKDLIITKVMSPLMEASAKARDLSGFIRQWYESLCKVTELQEKKYWGASLWADVRLRQQLADLLQASLSVTQILRLFEFLDTPESNPTALLVILDGMCAGITQEEYVTALDPRLFAAAFQDKKYKKIPSDIAALRWRIAGYMAAWENSEEVARLWEEVKSGLKKTLKSGELTDIDTFEAFRCCHEMWLTHYHGGKFEVDAAKLSCTFVARLLPEFATAEFSEMEDRYLDLVFGSLPRFVELGGAVATELLQMLKSSFLQLCKQWKVTSSTSPKLLVHIRTILESDAEDQETVIDALLGQVLDLLDNPDGEGSDVETWSLPVVLILEQFPTESWTRVRRKRLLGSWKNRQALHADRATGDALYSMGMLRLLVKVLQQPTFYEGMEFQDLSFVASLPSHGQETVAALAGKFIDLMLRHVVESTEQASADYLKAASSYVEALDTKHPAPRDFLLLKGLSAALKPNHVKSRNAVVDADQFKQKLRESIKYGLTDFSKRAGLTASSPVEQPQLESSDQYLLTAILGAADAVPDPLESIKLPKGEVLQNLCSHLVQSGNPLGWNLRKFLFRNDPSAFDNSAVSAQLRESSNDNIEALVNDYMDAFTKLRNEEDQAVLVNSCLPHAGRRSSLGPLLAVRYILEHIPALHGTAATDERVFDAPRILNDVRVLLTRATTLKQLKLLTEIMTILLDKHSASMTQFSIESILNVVAEVASSSGPLIQDAKGEGEIFECLYKLVATIIRRHRKRLEGHFPVLVATLQGLLRVILADPLARASTSTSTATSATPPWLSSRLRARHGARFARLLTLICEPSAAAVARSRRAATASAATTMLDSATDAAKRSAGQDMFHVVELYVKLQLEVVVPQDMRKALEPGIYSVLNITPEGCRRVMNESLDVNGRAVFRELFAAYKKFGRWSGV